MPSTFSTAQARNSRGAQGRVQVVARVCSVEAPKGASEALTEAAKKLSERMQAARSMRPSSSDLEHWRGAIEDDYIVGGGTVRVKYLSSHPDRPALLQAEWTSN